MRFDIHVPYKLSPMDVIEERKFPYNVFNVFMNIYDNHLLAQFLQLCYSLSLSLSHTHREKEKDTLACAAHYKIVLYHI